VLRAPPNPEEPQSDRALATHVGDQIYAVPEKIVYQHLIIKYGGHLSMIEAPSGIVKPDRPTEWAGALVREGNCARIGD
jgi:hypothetical protein